MVMIVTRGVWRLCFARAEITPVEPDPVHTGEGMSAFRLVANFARPCLRLSFRGRNATNIII